MMWRSLGVYLWSLVCVCCLAPCHGVSTMCSYASLECFSPVLEESTSEITKNMVRKSTSHILQSFISMKLHFTHSRRHIFHGQVKSIAHLDLTGWILYNSKKMWEERMARKKTKKQFQRKHISLIYWLYILSIAASFSLLSRQQPNSQGVLSAPYCKTSQGDWQTNRWVCHMFVKESKCSLQLTNSSDIFLSAILSLSLSSRSCCALHSGATRLVPRLSSSAEKCQIETHLAGTAGRVVTGYPRLCWLMEKPKCLQSVP